MQDLPLFEQVASDVVAGRVPPAEISNLTEKLRQRLDTYETISDESLSACLRSIEALVAEPSPARGRELDVACRLVSRSLMRSGGDASAWPALANLISRLESAEVLDFALQRRLEKELASIARVTQRPLYLETWKRGLAELAEILQSILAGALLPEEGAGRLQEFAPRLDRLWSEEVAAGYTSGPTKWPALNAAILVGRAFQQGQVLAATLEAAIHGLLDSVETLERSCQLVDMEGGAQGAAGSAQIAETLEEQLRALSEAALQVLAGIEEGQDLGPLWPTLESTGTEAAQAIQTFVEACENIGKTPCIRCGTPNPSDRSQCLRCNAILPRDLQTQEGLSLAEQTAGQHSQGGGYLTPLLAAIDEAILDSERLDELGPPLQAYEKHFIEAAKATAQMPEGVTAETYAEVMRLTGEGIEMLKEGSVESLYEGRNLLLEAQELSKTLLSEAG